MLDAGTIEGDAMIGAGTPSSLRVHFPDAYGNMVRQQNCSVKGYWSFVKGCRLLALIECCGK